MKRTVGSYFTAASMSAMILYIITNAAVFSWLLTSEQIPQSMAEWMTAQGFGTVAFLLVTNIVLLAAGNFMDPAAIVLIMAPILFPMGATLGVNPVHLGILMAVNMESRLVSPAGRAEPLRRFRHHRHGHYRGLTVAVLPWLATMLVFLVMVTYIPAISLWLPHLPRHAVSDRRSPMAPSHPSARRRCGKVLCRG